MNCLIQVAISYGCENPAPYRDGGNGELSQAHTWHCHGGRGFCRGKSPFVECRGGRSRGGDSIARGFAPAGARREGRRGRRRSGHSRRAVGLLPARSMPTANTGPEHWDKRPSWFRASAIRLPATATAAASLLRSTSMTVMRPIPPSIRPRAPRVSARPLCAPTRQTTILEGIIAYLDVLRQSQLLKLAREDEQRLQTSFISKTNASSGARVSRSMFWPPSIACNWPRNAASITRGGWSRPSTVICKSSVMPPTTRPRRQPGTTGCCRSRDNGRSSEGGPG